MNKKDTSNHIHDGDTTSMRELVFGMEDGMVSTLGAITGIAAATQSPFTILLSGFVIIGVESISMGMGSYLSSKSVQAMEEKKLIDEKKEVEENLENQIELLRKIYLKNGWSKSLVPKMIEDIKDKPDLILKEMACNELKIHPEAQENPAKNGLVMGVSYIFGGLIPVIPYVVLPLGSAVVVSLGITFFALFLLGAYTTKFSHRNWFKAGLEMLILAGLAATVGYIVGQVVEASFF